MVSNLECETAGILLGIEIIISYFDHYSITKPTGNISAYLCCDCDSAVKAMDRINHNITPYILRKILESHRQLSAASINVILVKVPGHAGIEGNETADRHTKDIAFRLFKGEVSAPNMVSVQTAFKIAGEIAMKSWQRFWDNEQSGQYTYDLIPSVKSNVLFSCDSDTGISYCRLLLHNSMLKDDSYRSGIILTPVCDCGISRETMDLKFFQNSCYILSQIISVKEITELSKIFFSDLYPAPNDHCNFSF